VARSRNEPQELPEGLSLLDRYTIIDRIGSGGMATIYRAHDTRLDRIVCVKLLRLIIEGSGSASEGVIYQATYTHFLTEARSLSKLVHPNTLRIYDFGYIEGGRPFQISEFLDAGNLEHYVRARGALKPNEVLAILDRVAGAAGEAHSVGIIHRDVKPSNILFSRVGDVLMPKLADFGIAREVRRKPKEGESEITSQFVRNVPLFSPRWAAPEQLASGEEGPYTDVYSLGLVVAYMLSGKSLFDLPDITATFHERVRSDDFVRARLREHPWAPEVARVLVTALKADPRSRTQSPFDFYVRLAEAFGTPRASLPSPVAHSGGVPGLPPRKPHESVTLETGPENVAADAEPQSVAPPERWAEVGGRRVRVVETHERLDLAVPTAKGVDMRFRVTLLPARGTSFRVNIKGLNCFIARPGGTPSPALVAETDGEAELISSQRERIGTLSWSFGAVRGPDADAGTLGQAQGSRVFTFADANLVIPFPQGTFAVALELGHDRELIVICRRG
jgi:serine/threonine protein kinase